MHSREVTRVLTSSLLLFACSAGAPPGDATSSVDLPIRASPAEQARMQAYIDGFVDMRYVRASFSDPGADILCVDYDKQPACVANPGTCGAAPAPLPPPQPRPEGMRDAAEARSPLPPGTAFACPKGTVPIRRPTIEVLRRYPTLEDYIRGFKGRPPEGR